MKPASAFVFRILSYVSFMKEHVELLKEQGLPVPLKNPDSKIIIQNEKKMAVA